MKKILFGWLLFVPCFAFASILPSANVQISPKKGDIKTRFTLDMTLARNTNGLKLGLQYRVKVSRNTPVSEWSHLSKYSFYPQKTGDFESQIWVKDRFGNENTSYVKYRVSQETFRRVRLTLSEGRPASGDPVEMKVLIVSPIQKDKDQALVRWDFTSDGHFDTNFSISKSIYHLYTGGQTSPTVEVKFPDGEIKSVRGFESVDGSLRSRTPRGSWTKIVSKPVIPKAPIIEVSPGKEVFNESTIFVFDASKTQNIGNLEWSIDGIKSFEGVKKIQHKFISPGVHQVRVRNCDITGICAETTLEVKINANTTDALVDFLILNMTDPSSRGFQQDFAQVTQGDRLRFNARILNNFDPKQRWKYRWDFDGDGKFDTLFSKQIIAEHVFDKTGTFKVVLEAQGQRSSEKMKNLLISKSVIGYRNQAPKGKIWFKNLDNYVGERIAFEALLGDRNSGNNLEIRTDSDGDGVWDNNFMRQKAWWWKYEEPGTYKVIMQIRDPQKKVFQIKRTLEVLSVPSPEIKVKVSHRVQEVGKNFTLDASKTKGIGLNYEWKIIGNPYISGNGSRTNFKFNKPGEYIICLRVIDRAVHVQEVNIPITVVRGLSKKTNSPASSSSGKKTQIKSKDLEFMGVNVPKGITLDATKDPFAVTSGYTPKKKQYLTGMRPGW